MPSSVPTECRVSAAAESKDRSHSAGLYLIIACITAFAVFPFVNKAFHIDDPVFLKVAHRIIVNPLDPYGTTINWYGREQPMSMVQDNPPLASYYIAAVAVLFGWSEPVLHAAFFPFALAVVLGAAALSRRAGASALFGAVVCLFSPLLLVSSTNIMADTMMASFFVWSLVLWIRGGDRHSILLLTIAALLASLGALTKYFAICALPLMAAYTIARKRGESRSLVLLIIPVAVMACYELWSAAQYGHGLLSRAAGEAARLRWYNGKPAWDKGFIGLMFAGAVTPAFLCLAPRLFSGKRLTVLVLISLTVVSAYLVALPDTLAGMSQGRQSLLVIEMALLAASGLSLLAAVGAPVLHKPNDPLMLMLRLWVLGTFMYCTFINWTINGPPMALIAPPAAVILARELEERGRQPVRWMAAAVVLAAALSLVVCRGDYRLAASAKEAAETAGNFPKSPDAAVWFQGHWGFQYYMEQRGAKAVDKEATVPADGDVIVLPSNNSNVFGIKQRYVAENSVIDIPAGGWVTTMVSSARAGFYSYIWGPLPFSFGPVPPEHYDVVTFRAAVDEELQ